MHERDYVIETRECRNVGFDRRRKVYRRDHREKNESPYCVNAVPENDFAVEDVWQNI